MMRDEILANIHEKKVIAIVRGFTPAQCLKLADALYAGGLNMIEVTFNQKDPDSFRDTTEAIRQIREKFEGKVYPGAGTVMTKEQVEMAADAGALYMISPDMNPEVIACTREKELVSLPGAMSPTEVVAAHNAGADIVKIFPASVLGPAYIKAIRGPLSHIEVMAVGGVSPDNIGDFIKAGAVGAGVGGLLTKRDLIEAGEFGKITEIAKQYLANSR